tara:strand:+ start:99 stop:446 length:348 start_codon:yes stop_codon:yes gene_type:complete
MEIFYNIGDMIVTNQVEVGYPYHEDPPLRIKITRYGVILGFIDYNLRTSYVPIEGKEAHRKFRVYWNDGKKSKISIIEEAIVRHEIERGHWVLVQPRSIIEDRNRATFKNSGAGD